MPKLLNRIVLGSILACAAAAAFGDIKWTPTFQEAMSKAKATNKLVMVEFYAAWDIPKREGSNNWCGQMEEETLSDAKVVALADKVIPVRLDVEKDGLAQAKKYQITNYPTVLFLDKDGRDVGKIDGFEPADEFLKHTNAFLKDYSREPALLGKYKSNPKDLDAITGLGIIEGNRYHIAAALDRLKEAEAIDPKNQTGKLTDLYSSIGDYYQNASKYDPAITYFKKGGDTAKTTDQKAYAWLSIATCYMTMDRDPALAGDDDDGKLRDRLVEHLKAAKPYVEKTLTLPGLKPEDKQIADNDLKNINDFLRIAGGG